MTSTTGPSGERDGKPGLTSPPPTAIVLFPRSSKHRLFCEEMGIEGGTEDHVPVAKPGQFYDEKKKTADNFKYQYWFVASTINFILLLQIVLGATATALTASKINAQVVSTIFTAIITVAAGVLAFLKSKGQPNRARQFHNDLRKVVERIENFEIEFRDPNCKREVVDAVASVRNLYETARANAETNYPHQWATTSNVAVHSNFYDLESGNVRVGFGPVQVGRSNATVTNPTSEQATVTDNGR